MKSKLLPMQVRAMGEHYALSRLLSCGFVAGLAPENTKKVDIIAVSEYGEKHLQIQVKTRTVGRSADEGWHMQQKHESIVSDNLFYIFVAVPSVWSDRCPPKTYIISSKKVASILKKTHQDWLNALGVKGQRRKDTKMRRIKPCYKDSPAISDKWMEEYKDNWAILQRNY